MEFCHITPTKYVDLVADHPRHLLLAHLVETNEDYVNKYLEIKNHNPNTTFILDNSLFELFKAGKKPFESEKLIDLGKKVNADYIVMSDYPTERWTVTRNKAIELAPIFKEAGFKTFYVPQSELGDLEGLLDSICWGLENDDVIDLIGMSILACPIALGLKENRYNEKVEGAYRLQRYLSRKCVFDALTKRLYRNEQYNPLFRKIRNRFHCLGMTEGYKEIELLQDPIRSEWIASWDSSSAVWHGLNGIKYDNSPTGLVNGKFEEEVDFNYSTNNKNNIEKAKANVATIDELIQSLTF